MRGWNVPAMHATHLFLQAAEVPPRQVPRLRRDGASGGAVLLGIRVRAAARDLLFCKMSRLRQGHAKVGTVINFFTNDTQRMLDAGNFGIFIVTPVGFLQSTVSD